VVTQGPETEKATENNLWLFPSAAFLLSALCALCSLIALLVVLASPRSRVKLWLIPPSAISLGVLLWATGTLPN